MQGFAVSKQKGKVVGFVLDSVKAYALGLLVHVTRYMYVSKTFAKGAGGAFRAGAGAFGRDDGVYRGNQKNSYVLA